ncbi:energy-coupling factor ABC transporter ATP-binding protein [Desulfovibrio inopinatus]|uniref:energy-coupling factor ABC transporter ATP-binding protein n=1 Tax=Desulfovibrio inopinatus TaxID=102109 RepID=UPI0004125900|nr:ABC transporter ATP-binding protein [Desulfovibrio inopinatus]
MTALLGLRHISYTYPGRNHIVLDNIDVELSETERVGLIGSNGSGKTTLLHIMMGLIAPDGGDVLFKQQPCRTEADFSRLRREVGFVFQHADDQLFSPTVLDDVAFGPLNQGLSPEQAREKASETLAQLGLTGFEDKITHRLSGGEKRLVALATILSMDPAVLILDEPTNDLDPDTRDRLINILRNLPQALLIVSHDWDFLHQTVETLMNLDQGHLHILDKSTLHTHRHTHVGGSVEHHHA